MNKLELLNFELQILSARFIRVSAEIQQKKTLVIRGVVIKCLSCGKGARLRRWALVEYLGKPHSILCPYCNQANRIFQNSQQNKIMDLINQDVVHKKIFNALYRWAGGNHQLHRTYPEPE